MSNTIVNTFLKYGICVIDRKKRDGIIKLFTTIAPAISDNLSDENISDFYFEGYSIITNNIFFYANSEKDLIKSLPSICYN